MSCILLAQVTDLRARSFDARSGVTKWPTHGWAKGKPSSVGLDEKILAELDGDLASGKYSLVDSSRVPLRDVRLRARLPPRLRTDLRERGEDARAAERASHRSVQLFRSGVAPLLSRNRPA